MNNKNTIMNINIIEVPTPMTSSFTMFEEFPKARLLEEKKLRVIVSHETKTRVSTTIQLGNCRLGVNLPVEGFKTFEAREHSYLTGETNVKHYFVKSKKQDLDSYKEYLKQAMEKAIKGIMYLDLDELTIELEADKF